MVLILKFIQYFKVPDEGELIELVKQAFEMNTSNFNKMGLIKVNGQQRFPIEEDEESEESTVATADALENVDSGALGADASEDNAEGGATDGATNGATGNTPMDIEDDTTEETDKNSEFTKFAQEILDKLNEISTEQKSNQEINIARFENLEQQVEAVLDKLATMAGWNEPLE